MSQEKYFSIIVQGKQSSEAEEGEFNKTTGMPAGQTVKVKVQVGSVSIPNFSRVWAKRLRDKKTEVLTGEIQFLKWGTAGGEMVQMRYLEGVPSLDKQFQKTVLKIELSEEELNEAAYIDLNIGVNDFASDVDPLFIEFIKHHTYNEDNESRKPTNTNAIFAIYNAEKITKNKVEEMRQKQRAQNYIIAAEGETDRLIVLANMFELDPKLQNEVLFNQLLEILEEEPKRVLDVVKHHETKFRTLLNSLQDEGVIVEHEDDLVEVIDNKRDFLYKGIDQKDKVGYLVNNLTDPTVFAVYDRVKQINEQLLALLQ
jgi:hypothetical protein